MKPATIILSLLASVAVAQPHRQPHRHQHEARNQAVKWVTEWAYETEVVAVTETIWVSEGFVPPTTTSETSTAKTPAQFYQPKSKSSSPTPSPSPSPSTTSVYVAPPPVSTPEPTTAPPAPKAPEPEAPEPKAPEPEVPEAKAPEPKAPEPKAAEPTTSTTTTSAPPAPSPEPIQPESKPESVYSPPAPVKPTSSSVEPAPASNPGSDSGECTKGSPCTGEITHYDANAGIGACGWLSDGENENVIALPHGLMGTQSNGNPYCGRKVTVTLNGKSIVAEIVDKCMGCTGHSIDLSNAAFKELEDMGVGRTEASWYFIS